MLISKIKPIPKYIIKLIKKYDLTKAPKQDGHVRFYSYLTKNNGELVQVTVAVKNKYKKWYCKQVVVHGIHSDKCFLKDIVYYTIAGYVVGWHNEGLSKYKKWFEDNEWGWHYDKYFNIYAPIVNREFLSKFPEYKYSAVDKYSGNYVLKYLRLYEQYPQIEYLTKLGIYRITFSKQILRFMGKDKKFCRWLAKNRNELSSSYFYISTIIQAYKKNKPLMEIQKYYKNKIALRDNELNPIKELFKNDLEKFFLYITQQDINAHSYLDYLTACNYLNLDMTLPKNRYPHDFKRWHDIRIDEYHTAKALKDEEERKEFDTHFNQIAKKYISLEYDKKCSYIAVIAQKPSDLVYEGEKLNHCVGRMNYDQKFIREESLIFFIREKESPNTPFVTLEYSLSKKKVLQCYGENDHKPSEQVLEFVNHKWLPFANRQLRKIQTAA